MSEWSPNGLRKGYNVSITYARRTRVAAVLMALGVAIAGLSLVLSAGTPGADAHHGGWGPGEPNGSDDCDTGYTLVKKFDSVEVGSLSHFGVTVTLVHKSGDEYHGVSAISWTSIVGDAYILVKTGGGGLDEASYKVTASQLDSLGTWYGPMNSANTAHIAISHLTICAKEGPLDTTTTTVADTTTTTIADTTTTTVADTTTTTVADTTTTTVADTTTTTVADTTTTTVGGPDTTTTTVADTTTTTIADTTTTTIAGTTTTTVGGPDTTTTTVGGTTTTVGDNTTTTVLGPDEELPETGIEFGFELMLGGFGLLLFGFGAVLFGLDRRWVRVGARDWLA
jgi:hypothetical protein